MTQETRVLLLSIKSLLMRAVDLIDMACGLGKYRKSVPVTISENDSLAFSGIISEESRLHKEKA